MDSQIALQSYLLENSTLPQELDELILYYLQLLYDGQYKCEDLLEFPNTGVTHVFMLNMKIQWRSSGDIILCYKGEVNVTRTFTYEFTFAMDGTCYKLSTGSIFEDISGAPFMLMDLACKPLNVVEIIFL